jgi:hypothetical protein
MAKLKLKPYQADLSQPQEFVVWVNDAIGYRIEYLPQEDGSARITFLLLDREHRGAWATSAETTSESTAFFEERGGYPFLQDWAQSMATMEHNYFAAMKAFEVQEALLGDLVEEGDSRYA